MDAVVVLDGLMALVRCEISFPNGCETYFWYLLVPLAPPQYSETLPVGRLVAEASAVMALAAISINAICATDDIVVFMFVEILIALLYAIEASEETVFQGSHPTRPFDRI